MLGKVTWLMWFTKEKPRKNRGIHPTAKPDRAGDEMRSKPTFSRTKAQHRNAPSDFTVNVTWKGAATYEASF